MDESRSDSEKMDKKEKSDDYDSPSDFVECFLTKGIFEAARTSHQRKQILLGVERKLSVAQRDPGVCVAMA